MPVPLLRILLLACLLWVSWLTMMLVHEGGHVLGAVVTGGTVRRVVWHPMVLSRTDVSPNPWPRIEVWAGPGAGCVLPLLGAAVMSAVWRRGAYLGWFTAGFCLIANGAYLGYGCFDPVGDAHELIVLHTPRWALAAFGVVTVAGGIWIWHRVSPRLGSGSAPVPVNAAHAYAVVIIAVLMTAGGMIFGNRGG